MGLCGVSQIYYRSNTLWNIELGRNNATLSNSHLHAVFYTVSANGADCTVDTNYWCDPEGVRVVYIHIQSEKSIDGFSLLSRFPHPVCVDSVESCDAID